MSRMDWVFLLLLLMSAVLFLYGANFYDTVIGWAGIYLFIAGSFAYVILKEYVASRKKKQ